MSNLKNIALAISILLASSSIYSVSAASSIPGNIVASSNLTVSDFGVTIAGQRFAIGDEWNEKAIQLAGKEESGEFVGDVPSGDSSYKFWQHNYSGYSLYSSNIFWDKQQRSIDSYLIAQISLDSPVITTFRGIKVGDTESKLVEKYGSGAADDSDDQHWIGYESSDKRIAFQIENKKISHITMLYKLSD